MQQRQALALLSVVLVVAIGLAAWLWPGCPRATSTAPAVELPASVDGWTPRGPTASYDPTTIFDYIDGHAEVYLAYGLRRCLTRRYGGPDGEADIVVDLFELASAADAFGVATYDREGSSVAIGRDALLRHGWLSFWQDAFFVSVLSERETGRSRAAVVAMGRDLANRLPSGGSVPAIVSALPAVGLDPRQVRFLRHSQILNTHLFVDDENLLGLGPSTSAALGRYARDGSQGYLLLVDYPSASLAGSAADAFGKRFALDPTEGIAQVMDRGWFAARARDARLAAVIDAGSQQLAATLLSEALDRRTGGKP